MYEPIRTKSVHSMAAPPVSRAPSRSRDEELTLQLAAAFEALLTVMDELGTEPELCAALADHVTALQGGRAPQRLTDGGTGTERVAALRRRAHALASRALVLAESRQDTASAELAERALARETVTV